MTKTPYFLLKRGNQILAKEKTHTACLEVAKQRGLTIKSLRHPHLIDGLKIEKVVVR